MGTSIDDAYRQAFEIDFAKCLVVALLKGDQINVRGVQVDSLIENDDEVIVRFSELTYQTANESNNRSPDKPFAFIVLPNTRKQIILEEGTRTMSNEPMKWKELIRLK